MKNIFLEMKEIRDKIGKQHMFHSVNKLILRLDNGIPLDKVYISKEYLKKISNKLFNDDMRILDFLFSYNEFVRLSLVDEISQDLNFNIIYEIQNDIANLKTINSSIYSDVKNIINEHSLEDFDLSLEEKDSLKKYFDNLLKLKEYISYFDIETSNKYNYFHRVIKNYMKYFNLIEIKIKDFKKFF